jgi:UDP-N-acetylglucosamine acyltransferase
MARRQAGENGSVGRAAIESRATAGRYVTVDGISRTYEPIRGFDSIANLPPRGTVPPLPADPSPPPRLLQVKIHPLAVVHPSVKLGHNVTIGPFAIIEAGAAIGHDCTLEARAVVKAGTTLGDNNHVFEGAVLGGLPQHVRMPERPGGLIIGSSNTVRENVTIHRAMEEGHLTIIGNNNLLMVNAHIAHDCHIGHHTIFANNAMMAGHVLVEDRAFISGGVAVHQFCRIGRMAMVGGQARVVKDVPPFVTIDGASNFVVGLNTIGLRRSGATTAEITELKIAYRLIYRSGLKWSEILDRLSSNFHEGLAGHFYAFLIGTQRGIAQERRFPAGATIKMPELAEPVQPAAQLRAKAG